MSVEAIQKREDVPNPENEPNDIPYGDEVNKRYKLGTEQQIRTAWGYIHHPDNADKYSDKDLKIVRNRIIKYWKLKIDPAGPPAAQGGMGPWVGKLVQAAIEGQFSFGLDSSAPGEIMYMPAGNHTIEATVAGKPKTLDVKVTARTAQKLQSDLDALLSENVEPFVDFDHEGKAAAAIPKRFKWIQGKGVYLELEWTKGGRERVEGKDYRYFSPTFNIGDDGEPSGLPESGAIGALVNNPAFRDMARIAASRAKQNGNDAEPETKTMSSKMKSTLMKLGIINDDDGDMSEDDMADRLSKKVKGWKDEVESAKAKMKGADKGEKDAEDEIKKMKDAKDEAEAKLAKMINENAEAAVEAAIQAGKIPGKDEGLKSFYVESFKSNPEGTKKALAAITPRGVFLPVVVPDGRDKPAAVQASQSAYGSPDRQAVMAQRAIISKVKAANPGATPDTIFAIASQEYPEAFADG